MREEGRERDLCGGLLRESKSERERERERERYVFGVKGVEWRREV